jgi:hypothetical protein
VSIECVLQAKDIVVPVMSAEQKTQQQQGLVGLVQSINRGISLLDQPSTSGTMTESDYEQVSRFGGRIT